MDRKYEVLRPLGAGAMAHVYEATHRLTGREVALKVMNASYLQSPDAARRFLREVRLATELRHPGVVEVIDAGQDPESEQLYIAMERLHGEDLGDRLAQDPPLTSVLGWLLEMLPVLAMAHERGVVHRDLKPENTFLASNEEGGESIKLLDFGIARSLTSASLTQTGMTLGTPIYMSPEQALRPQEADHRADLWAFGVMLYEAVAGVPPFNDDNPHAVVLRAAAETQVPLHVAVPGTPERLSKLVDRCLEKAPEDRPADAGEIEKELAAILASGEVPLARPAPPRPSGYPKTAPFVLAQDALKRYSDPPVRAGGAAATPALNSELGSAATLAGESGSLPPTRERAEKPRRRAGWAVVALLVVAAGVGGALWLNRGEVAPDGPTRPATGVAEEVAEPPHVTPTSVVEPLLEPVGEEPGAEELGDEGDAPEVVAQDTAAPLEDPGPEAPRASGRSGARRGRRVVRTAPNPVSRSDPGPADTSPAEPLPTAPRNTPTVVTPTVGAAPRPAASPSTPRPAPAPSPRPRRRPAPQPAPTADPSPPPFSFK